MITLYNYKPTRVGRSTTAQIFIIRQLHQKTWEFDKGMLSLFVYFRKAYDNIIIYHIHRESLLNIMKKFNFPHKLINLISVIETKTLVKIRVRNTISDPIAMNSGLKQEDSLLPIICNIVSEKVIRKMNLNLKRVLNYKIWRQVYYPLWMI